MSAGTSKPTAAAFAAAVIVVIWIALAKVPVAWNEDRWDSRYFQLTGLEILDGATPYREFWDVKPPGTFYLMALAGLVSDTSLVQIAVLDGLFNLLALLVAARILQLILCLNETGPPRAPCRLGTAGWLCLALAAVLSSHTALILNGNQTESYLLFPEALSVALGIGAVSSTGTARAGCAVNWRGAFAAGVFGALAGWFRPTGLAGIGALELAWLAHRRWRLALAGMAGLAAGIAPGVALFWHWGLAGELLDASMGLALSDAFEVRGSLRKGLEQVWPLHWPALLVLAWLLWRVSATLWNRASPARRGRFAEAETAVLLWVALDLAGALLPGMYRQHYFLPLGISLPVAAAFPLAALSRRGMSRGDHSTRRNWIYLFVSAAMVLWILIAARAELRRVLSARPVEQSAAPWMQVVRYLRGQVSPGERIFVADYAPSIYVLTRTRPASRWVYLEKAHYRGSPTEQSRQEAFREAMGTRPRFIVSGLRTPAGRAAAILEHSAVRVFACREWVVWRRLDKLLAEPRVAPATPRLSSAKRGPARGRRRTDPKPDATGSVALPAARDRHSEHR